MYFCTKRPSNKHTLESNIEAEGSVPMKHSNCAEINERHVVLWADG